MGRLKEAPFACDHEAFQQIIESDRWCAIVSQLRLSRRERQIVESTLLGMDTRYKSPIGYGCLLAQCRRTCSACARR